MTPARVAANRVRRWIHGRYARSVTHREVARAKLEQEIPGAASVLEAYHAALEQGDFSGVEMISSLALAESELVRRQAVDDILERGVAFDEPVLNGKGEEIGTRLRAHPLLDRLRHLDERLGHTADQLRLTPKSRGGKTVNAAALAFRLERDAQLRALDQDRRQLPPPLETPGDLK
jgi:hypothetical protein